MESYTTPESLESFLKKHTDGKSECWMCQQILRKIKEKTVLGDNDRYHMVVCSSQPKEAPSLKKQKDEKKKAW